jgi:hypothetical protein
VRAAAAIVIHTDESAGYPWQTVETSWSGENSHLPGSDAGAVTALIGALREGDAGVRSQAAWALGAIGDRRASDALLLALKDSDTKVRRQAAWALSVVAKQE